MLPVDAYMSGPHDLAEEHARREYADFDTQFNESEEYADFDTQFNESEEDADFDTQFNESEEDADFDTQFNESEEDAITLENLQYGIREVDLRELNTLIK